MEGSEAVVVIPLAASLETLVAESLRSCCTRFPLQRPRRNRSQEIGGITNNSTCAMGIGAQLVLCWTTGPAERPEPGDQLTVPPEGNPSADVEPDIETWRPLTSSAQ